MIALQQNMPAHEDLAALFARNLTFNAQPVEPPREEPKIIYSISQHYHHSAHLAHAPQEEPPRQLERPSSEPPQTEQPLVETLLRDNGVDASALSPSQLQLFKTAEDAQKLRLVELWRICPPANKDNPTLTWNSTSVEQEEALARMRYEQTQTQTQSQSQAQPQPQAQTQTQNDCVMSLDGTALTPIQAGDGRWLQPQPQSYMEPYMASMYEELAQREYETTSQRDPGASSMDRPRDVYSHFGTSAGGANYTTATDPVYKDTNGGRDWARQQQRMENQYGAYMCGGGDQDMDMF